MHNYDVIIVGGGVVGLTLALALVKADFKVLVLEKNAPSEKFKAITDPRVSAINLASQNLFKALGVWSPLVLRAGVFEQIKVFEGESYEVCFDSALIEQPLLGFIVSHAAMSQALTEALLEHDAEIWYASEIESISQQADQNFVTLKTGEKLSSQLVVGADGKHSELRELLGFKIKERDYHQTALVAQIGTEKSHQKTAWQCFLKDGPLAFLPLQDENTCSIVWSTLPEEANRLQNLSEEKFLEELKDAFENRLGNLTLQGARFTFPLKMHCASSFVKQGFALVGDAVHSIHPLAGQGLNLGLLDAACLAQGLVEARKQSNHIGNYVALRKYERWRKSQHLLWITAMDVFKNGFALNHSLFAKLRKQLMQYANQINFIKRYCMHYATGLVGDLPDICMNDFVKKD